MTYKWAYTMDWIKPPTYDPATYEPPMRPLQYRPKYQPAYNGEQLRRIKELRAEAAKDGILLPALPCPFRPCMNCKQYAEYWDKEVGSPSSDPATLSLALA